MSATNRMQPLTAGRALSALLVAVGVVMILGAATMFGLVATDVVGGGVGNSGPGTVTGFGSVLIRETPSSGPASAPTVTDAPLERIVIPSVNIDAPIVIKGLDEDGVMEAPDNAYDVAWYDFTPRPGEGSNAVFSGHVDYVNVGPAVFWKLKDLEPSARIDIRFAGGTLLSYAVMAVNTFDAVTAPIDEIVGPTPADSITLITCAGTFDQSTGQYDKRLIVRAERL